MAVIGGVRRKFNYGGMDPSVAAAIIPYAPPPGGDSAPGGADPAMMQALGDGMQLGSHGTPPTFGTPDLAAARAARPLGMFGNVGRASTGIDAVDQGSAPVDFATPKPADITGATPQKVRPNFFGVGGTGTKILNGLGEAALRFSASQGDPLALMTMRSRFEQQANERENATWMQRHNLERSETLSDRQYDENKPRYFSGGQDQVRYDPSTGQASTIYDAPSGAESYASNFGDKGTPEYRSAMQDYALRGWGPTAVDAKGDLNDERFNQRLTLKGAPTYANLHPRTPAPRPTRLPTTSNVLAGILSKVGAGQPLNPGEQDLYNTWKTGRRPRTGLGNAPSALPVHVSSPAEASKLPRGSLFITPDGVTRMRQ